MQFWKYKRILPKTQCQLPRPEDVDELIGLLKFSIVNSLIPAGYTYFGQFINHDLSFMDITDTAPANHSTLKLKNLVQRRKAALDLDSIYGAGIEDSHVPYDGKTGKFVMSSLTLKHGVPRDLPRQFDHIAQIADPRNDENMITAQLQVLFMNFHNKVVDHYRSLGERGGKKLFELARKEVVSTYIDLVLHDFAKRILPDKVYQVVVVKNKGLLSKANKKSPKLALEFATAAFRLHSMVRSSYTITPWSGVLLRDIFRYTGRYAQAHPNDGFMPLPATKVIDWRMFFAIDANEPHLGAKPLSPYVSIFNREKDTGQLHNTERTNNDEEINLLMRSILRGMSLKLPTGQEAISYLQSCAGNPDVAKEIGLEPLNSDLMAQLSSKNSLHECTPLWLYLMLEARGNKPKERAKTRLGELGGWLVADTLVTAARSVDLPGLQQWRPADSVIYQRTSARKMDESNEHVSFKDLVKFTYPDDF